MPTSADFKWLAAAYEKAAAATGERRARLLERARREKPNLCGQLERLLGSGQECADNYARSLARDASRALAPTRDGFRPGDRVGPFVIEGLLGCGGMGEVYLAHRSGKPSERVAVKTGEDVERESKFLAALDHPSVVGLLDTRSEHMVIDFIDGVVATAFARRASLDGISEMFLELCAAVSHCHERGVVHCDIKPANVIVRGTRPILLDFGIAQWLEAPRPAIGPVSVNYAAPEMFGSEPVDARTDVYSLGLLLHRLVAGKRLFECDPTSTVADNLEIRRRRPTPRLELGDLDPIVDQATRFESRHRFQTVAELAEAFQRQQLA